MSYCEKCGSKLGVDAAFCGSCGAGVKKNATAKNDAKPLQHAIGDVKSALQTIESLDVSSKWKHKFVLIESAGGPSMPKWKSMSVRERLKFPQMNLLALLFGPIYYLAKGMWKKALTYSAAVMIAVLLITIFLESLAVSESVIRAVSYSGCFWFASRANIDFYKKMVLSENGWW